MGTINATVSGVMTLDEFIAWGSAEWTVDGYTPHGQFHDSIASFDGTITEPVDIWQVFERPDGVTTYHLSASALEGSCGRFQFDMGVDGLDLKSLLVNTEHDCVTFHREEFDPRPVPEASTLILLVVGLLVWWIRR